MEEELIIAKMKTEIKLDRKEFGLEAKMSLD